MIIAVGFKVNSERAVQFRKWVNQIAKDYTIKGWVMDDERLKRGTYLTEKYFDEQLERIREIRASERKFYQKITDLYATAVDYDKNSATTRRFYATVQNKMHYAVHGHTAAELIVERADHTKEHMGLTTWADVPDDKVLCYLLERQLQEITTNISVKFEIEVWYNRESLGQDLKKENVKLYEGWLKKESVWATGILKELIWHR